ncbi:MAG: hypothetical protein MUE33_02360 [Cytophagaceae bacterium]|jgi:hypothetical protein|nr:hypothetical protein [Cytophagaceae bacterium]
MLCSAYILYKGAKGSVYYCNHCGAKIALMYGNLSISFEESEFIEFMERIHSSRIEAYFEEHPAELKIHIRSQLDTLFYSFTYTEIQELRVILDESYLKLKINKMLYHGSQDN